MFCPQCGAQAEAQIKFCKACGYKLTEHARLLINPEDTKRAATEELFLRKGTGGLIGSLLSFLLFGTIAGASLAFKPDLDFGGRLAVWLMLWLTPLLPGALGIYYLVRGGYFRNFRERQLRLELERLEQRRQALAAQHPEIPRALNAPSQQQEVASVIEATTRELQPVPTTQRSIKGE